jgi:hypothetical protein
MHDILLEKICSHSASVKAEARHKRNLARKVSRIVQAYWSAKTGDGEKARKAHERHLKSLAKWTVREVNKQWKLAVSVVKTSKAKADKLERERQEESSLGGFWSRVPSTLAQERRISERADSKAKISATVTMLSQVPMTANQVQAPLLSLAQSLLLSPTSTVWRTMAQSARPPSVKTKTKGMILSLRTQNPLPETPTTCQR